MCVLNKEIESLQSELSATKEKLMTAIEGLTKIKNLPYTTNKRYTWDYEEIAKEALKKISEV